MPYPLIYEILCLKYKLGSYIIPLCKMTCPYKYAMLIKSTSHLFRANFTGQVTVFSTYQSITATYQFWAVGCTCLLNGYILLLVACIVLGALALSCCNCLSVNLLASNSHIPRIFSKNNSPANLTSLNVAICSKWNYLWSTIYMFKANQNNHYFAKLLIYLGGILHTTLQSFLYVRNLCL